MRKVIYFVGILMGALVLNNGDTIKEISLKDFLNHQIQIEEMDEDEFQKEVNVMGEKVGTKIDFSDYNCSQDNTSYFVNDICLTNDDLKDIMFKVINNATPDRIKDALGELQE